jgi:PAS domain S-box-containing protein
MSAYGDSRFFLKAIESGVKGFLTKPLNNSQLQDIILEQATDILLEKKFHEEERKRQLAEKERDRSENILQALSFSTASFFRKGVNSITVNEALSKVGTITNVSRVYIFKKEVFKGIDVVSQIYEWVAQDVQAQLNNDDLVNIPIESSVFNRWNKILAERKNVVSIVRLLEGQEEREVLEQQNIKSVLAIPIFVRDDWWGFIGFDDCVEERIWSESEINALGMLAFNLGGAIYRRNVEDELNNLNANLEQRVKKRTLALQQEVSERINAEELLRESEEKYRLIYENANDGIALIKNGLVFLVNPRVSDIFKYMPRDIIGKHFSDFFLDEFKDDLNAFLSSHESAEHLKRNEITIEMLEGKWIELKTTFIVWDTEPAHLVFLSDVTKRKAAEMDLFELNSHLENRVMEEIKRVEQQQQLLVQKSKLESIGELSAGLAHEINQPLGGISMGLDNIQFKMLDKSLTDSYLKSKIETLFGDIERIRNIINHVRVFSRDQDKLVMETVDIKLVVDNALTMVRRQLLDQHVDVRTCLPDQDFYTLGNGYRLEQVLLNLLSNAKYAVEERARKAASSEQYVKLIMISLESEGEDNYILVEDNGTGIDEKIIPNIFNPFYTTKSEEKGTGLGLSISYGIIKEMKGTISVESEINKYTRIIIKLPKK